MVQISGNKFIPKFLSFICSLILILVILLTTIQINVFDLDFFRSEYVKLDTAKEIGITEQELMNTTQELLAYIKGERADLYHIEAGIKGEQREVFNQREIDHMVDVQRLYLNTHWLRNAGVIFLLLLLGIVGTLTRKKFWKVWAHGYLWGAGIFFILIGAIGIAIAHDFLWFWDHFHYLIFTNDLWMLNPETDILIQMVPEQFFFDLVTRILVSFAVTAASLTVVAYFIKVKYRDTRFNL